MSADKQHTSKNPDGSTNIRYENIRQEYQLASPAPELVRAREQAYATAFGTMEHVSHDITMTVPHIDVYVFKPSAQRPFYTVVSGGMSDYQMHSKENVKRAAPRRAELVMYVKKPSDHIAGLVRHFAGWPQKFGASFGGGHTIPNGGMPPQPLFNNSELSVVLLMPTIVRQDAEFEKSLQIGGDPVELLWIVPITEAECNLKLTKGLVALLDLFDERNHPCVLDEHRVSYV